MIRLLRLLAFALLVPAPALAQAPDGGRSPFAGATMELAGRYEHLTDQFAPTRTAGLTLVVPQSPTVWWRGEVIAGEHLGQGDVLVSLAHTRDLSERVYASAALSGSPGDALALPAARLDAMVYGRFGAKKQLVMGVGGFAHRAHDEHRDVGVTAEMQWYARDGLVVQAGGRLMHSNPGDAPGRHVYASVMLGREGRRFVAVRAGVSHEAYQVLHPLNTYVNFPSREASLTWREWTGHRSGLLAAVSVYQSPYFTRTSATVGVFRTLR